MTMKDEQRNATTTTDKMDTYGFGHELGALFDDILHVCVLQHGGDVVDAHLHHLLEHPLVPRSGRGARQLTGLGIVC